MRALSAEIPWWLAAGALAVGCVLATGCSGAEAEPCESQDDCFQDEFCQDGVCQQNTDAGPGNGGEDTGGGDTGGGDTGGDTGNGEVSCLPESDCQRGIDSDVTSGLVVKPEDHESNVYGCSDVTGSNEFVGVEDRTFTANTCHDSQHIYRIRNRTCSQVDYRVEVELIPTDPHCGVRELANVQFIYPMPGGNAECESFGDNHCFEEHDTPEHGGYKWTVWHNNIFQGNTTAHIELIIEPEEGAVPYELVVNVMEME